MRTIKFPKMFNTSSTNVWKSEQYNQATLQSTELLLQSERGELFGDPYYGLLLKHYLYSPNSAKLKDVIIDIIYTQLAIFIPQLKVQRKDIDIIQDYERARLYCRFVATSQIDYTVSTYDLILFQSTELIRE